MAHKETFILDFRADTTNVQSQFNQLKQTLMQLGSQQFGNFAKMSTDMQKATQDAAKMGAALKQAVNPSTGKLDLSRLYMQMESMNLTAAGVQKSFATLGASGRQAFMQIANAVANAQTPMIRTNALLDKMWATMKNTARWQISSIALNTLISGLRNSITFAKDLNKNLNEIRIVSGDSAKEMEKYALNMNKVAKSIGTNTNEMVEATVIFRQQGDDLETSAKKAEITAKAAAITLGTSAEEMSEYLTGIWNSYRVGSDELELFVDKLARVGATTAANAGELATAMTKVAATANTVGVSYDQLLATISTVTSATRQSAESIGTAYKTIYARMGDLTLKGSVEEDGVTTDLGQVSSQLKQAGIDIIGGDGVIKDMGTIVEEVGNKWEDMTLNMQTALAQAIGGKRQYTQVMALFSNWDEYNATLNESINAQGELNREHSIYLESMDAATQKTKAIKEDMIMDLVDDDAMIALVNGFNLVLEGLDELIEGIGGFQGVLSMLMYFIVNKFSKQIATSFTNLKANVMVFFGQADKMAQKEAQAWNKAVQKAQTNVAPGSMEAEQLKTLDAKFQVQHKIATEGKHLNDIEREILQWQFKQIEAQRQESLEQEKQFRLAQEQLKTEIMLSATREKRGLTKQEKALLRQADKNIYESNERDKVTEKKSRKSMMKTANEAVKTPEQKADERRKNIEKEITKELEKQERLRNKNKKLARTATDSTATEKERNKAKGQGKANRMAISESKERVKTLEEEAKKIEKQKKVIASPVVGGAEIFQGLTSGVMGLSMALSSARGMIDIFKDGFQFSDIIQALGSLGGVMLSINMLMQAGNALKIKESWASGLQAAAALKLAKSKGVETVAEQINTTETKLNTVAKIANFIASHPIISACIGIGAALAAATAIIAYNTSETVKNSRALEENAGKLKEIDSKINEEEKAMADQEEKLKNISDITSQEAKNIQKSINFRKEYITLLKQQAKIQKQTNANIVGNSTGILQEKYNKERNDGKFNWLAAGEMLAGGVVATIGTGLTPLTGGASSVAMGAGVAAMSHGANNLFSAEQNTEEQIKEIQDFMESDDYKNYLEMVSSLDEKDPEQAKKLVEAQSFIAEINREYNDLNSKLNIENAVDDLIKNHGYSKEEAEQWKQARLRELEKEVEIEKGFQDKSIALMLEYGSSVESVTSKIDNLQSAYKTLNEAVAEYNTNGKLSLDTFQSLVVMHPKYLNLLKMENGQLDLNASTMQTMVQAEKENLIIQQLSATLNQVRTMAETDMASALAYLTATTSTHTKTLEDQSEALINNAMAAITAKASMDGLTEEEREQINSIREMLNQTASNLISLNKLSVGLESSAKDVEKATDTLRDAQAELATFYLKKALDKNKREIEKFQKFVDNVDLALEFSGLEEENSIKAIQEKSEAMRKELVLTEKEFDELSKKVPTYAEEADEIFSRMEEYGESIKELKNNIKSANQEIEQLKWSAATEAFNTQLDQIDRLNEAASDLMSSFGESGSLAQAMQANAARRLLYGTLDKDSDKDSIEAKKKEYQEYLEMTKEIDEKVNKAHEKALEMNYKKEEKTLKDKVKEASEAYKKITRIHKEQLDQQDKDRKEAFDKNKRDWAALVQYYKDNPIVLSTIDESGNYVADKNDVADESASKPSAGVRGYNALIGDSSKSLDTKFEKDYNTRTKNIEIETSKAQAGGASPQDQITNLVGVHELAQDLAYHNYWNMYDSDKLSYIEKNDLSDFGQYRSDGNYQHNGEDIGGEKGMSIRAIRGGRVVENAYDDTSGNYIKIYDAATGMYFSYAHMDKKSSKKEGELIFGGDVIGKVGSTGRSDGNHVHLKIWKEKNGTRYYVDPGTVLKYAMNKYPTAAKGRTLTKDEQVFVGEKGEELIWIPSNDTAYLVKDKTLLDLPSGAVVYSNEETKEIMDADSDKLSQLNLGFDPSRASGDVSSFIPSGITKATELINNATTGLDIVKANFQYKYRDVAINRNSYDREFVYRMNQELANDMLWEVRHQLDELTAFRASEEFKLLDAEQQEAFQEAYNTILEKESSLSEEMVEVIQSYQDQRHELADAYIEKMDKFNLWDNVGDNRIEAELRMYNSMLETITDPAELERLRANTLDRINDAVDQQLSDLEEMAGFLTQEYKEQNELLEKQISRYNSIYDLTQKHFDMVNKLSDAQHKAEMDLYSSLQNAKWLDEKTRSLIYNTDDYARQLEQINSIRAEEEALFIQYQNDINRLSDEELWKAEFITKEYEKQLKLKEDEMTLLSLELELTKKRQALTNTLMEKNVRIYSGGRWVYAANQGNVQKAQQDLSEAQYKYDQQQTKMAQQEALDKIDASKTEAEKLMAENEAQMEAINKTLEDGREAWERWNAELKFGELTMSNFEQKLSETATAIANAKAEITGIQSEQEYYSTGKSFVSAGDAVYVRGVTENLGFGGIMKKAEDYLASRKNEQKSIGTVTRYTKDGMEIIQSNANGTASSKAGWSSVNEKGVELYATNDGQFIELNPYEKIFNNEQFEFLYNLSRAGTEGVSSIMRNYNSDSSWMNIENLSLALPNVKDTDSFIEGLRNLKDYIKNTKTINR